ncbi:hypothetical protein [uncultured Draconibacterium sp.]|uniref:hypothetical protein n=1 Tax=uncultured Draconibacterium sp. TaxID=1573823 RepID=UPI0029C65FB2|nr:hypothetical protein [uncultured Draconibacterium sp.]
MKQNSILLLIFSLFLFSCDNDDPVVIETNLPLTVPIEVSEASAIEHESGRTDYAFTASGTYYLSDNDDLKDNLDDITSIFGKSVDIGLSGLAEGDTINHLIVSVGESTVQMNMEDWITFTNNGMFGGGYMTLGEALMEDKQITVTVEGTTRKAPMNFNVIFELLIDAALADEE